MAHSSRSEYGIEPAEGLHEEGYSENDIEYIWCDKEEVAVEEYAEDTDPVEDWQPEEQEVVEDQYQGEDGLPIEIVEEVVEGMNEEEIIEEIIEEYVEGEEEEVSAENYSIEVYEEGTNIDDLIQAQKIEKRRQQTMEANRRWREKQRRLEGRPFGRRNLLSAEERKLKNKEKCRLYREKLKQAGKREKPRPALVDGVLISHSSYDEVEVCKYLDEEEQKAMQEKMAKRREQVMLGNRRWRAKKRAQEGRTGPPRRPLTDEERAEKNRIKCRRYKERKRMQQLSGQDDGSIKKEVVEEGDGGETDALLGVKM